MQIGKMDSAISSAFVVVFLWAWQGNVFVFEGDLLYLGFSIVNSV